MTEYITLMEDVKIMNALESYNGIPRFKGYINGTVEFTGEIVRCRDCVHFEADDENWTMYCGEGILPIEVACLGTEYCSLGRRKE